MKPTLVNLLLLVPMAMSAQTFDADAGTTGYIKTTQGKFEGIVDVNFSLNQVLWSRGNETRIFGPSEIKEVKFTRADRREEKLYCGLELAGEHYLFEVITTGKIEILYREGIKKGRFEDTTFPPYFVLGKKKELISLEREKDFLDTFGGDAKWMKQFIKNRNLSLDKKEDIRYAFNYYNSQYELINP